MSDGPSLIRDFAHELRNAISPIRSAADVLRVRGSDPAVLEKSLAHIRRSLDAALQTIDAFVTADRAMTGTLTLEPGVYPLGGLFDEAIARINATPYGLATGLFTNRLDEALKAARRLEVGGVHINETSSSRVDLMPYGGSKDSGFGREGPHHAVREMSEERMVTVSA